MNLHKLSPVFGCRIEDDEDNNNNTNSTIDISQPLTHDQAKEIQAALQEHRLVVIRTNKQLENVHQLVTFGESLRLGEPQIFGAQTLVADILKDTASPHVLQLEYGPAKPPADINIWHQDHTWRPHVTRYELSYMHVAAPNGGGTVCYADAVQAYANLSKPLQQMLRGMTAMNVLAQGYQNLTVGSPAYMQALQDHPPISQPVVATCKDGKSGGWLNVNPAYTVRINELTRVESDAMLKMLFAHIHQPEHVLRLHYKAGDVILFDNHRLQHYAVSDYYPHVRTLWRMSFDPQPLISASSSSTSSTTNGNHHSTSKEATSKAALATKSTNSSATTRPIGTAAGASQAVARLATDLTAGIRLLHQDGHSDLCAGFFSARLVVDDDEDGAAPTTPSTQFLAPFHGTHWDEMTPSDFGVFDAAQPQLVAAAVDGDSASRKPNYPTTAVPAAIFKAFPEIQAMVHAHPRSVMALAALMSSSTTATATASGDKKDDPEEVHKTQNLIWPISEPSFMFYERIQPLECNFFFDEDYLQEIVKALRGGAFCLMMKNHSYLMVGKSIPECYLRCYMLEQSASIQLQVMASSSTTTNMEWPSHEECLYHRRSYEGYDGCPPYDGQLEWPGLIRRLHREHPGWDHDQGRALGRAYEEATSTTRPAKIGG